MASDHSRDTRISDKGLPRYFDAEEADVFILSDAEDLPALLETGEQWNTEWAIPYNPSLQPICSSHIRGLACTCRPDAAGSGRLAR
jgi:hypothetical protein